MNTDPLKSAQGCGCDEGANYKGRDCKKHKMINGRLVEVWVETTTIPTLPDTSWEPLRTIKDSGERVKYASGAMRDPSTGKVKWSRITFGPMMRRWAQHLTTAEAKYPDAAPGVPNFSLIESEEEFFRYKESAFRHFMSWFYNETDEDHAAAVFFNINGVEIIKDKQKRSTPKASCDGAFVQDGRSFDCDMNYPHVGNHDSELARAYRKEKA